MLSGVATPTSDAVTGTFECVGTPYSGSFAGSRSLCDNGVIDPGEDCESDSECCGITCLWAPAGTACTSDGNACTDDRCDGAHVCAHPPGPAGVSCGNDDNPCTVDFCDASGLCHRPGPAGVTCSGDGNPCTDDVCDASGACTHPINDNSNACDDGSPCTENDACSAGVCAGVSRPAGSDCSDGCFRGTCDGAMACSFAETSPCCRFIPFGGLVPYPWPGCHRPTRPNSRLQITVGGPGGARDRLKWKWRPSDDAEVADFGDPTAATDYTFCLFSITFPFYLADATIPAGGTCAGSPCWRAKSTGFEYNDRDATSDGIRTVSLKARADGNATITMAGKGPNLNVPAPLFPEAGEVVTQLRASNGECWEARYFASKTNQSKYKAAGQ